MPIDLLTPRRAAVERDLAARYCRERPLNPDAVADLVRAQTAALALGDRLAALGGNMGGDSYALAAYRIASDVEGILESLTTPSQADRDAGPVMRTRRGRK